MTFDLELSSFDSYCGIFKTAMHGSTDALSQAQPFHECEIYYIKSSFMCVFFWGGAGLECTLCLYFYILTLYFYSTNWTGPALLNQALLPCNCIYNILVM